MTSPWYETFFQGIALDMWRAAITREQTVAEADFLERLLAPPAGGKLLDVPCGNGRLVIELGRRGYRLTGIDISQEFLAEARQAASAAGVAATLQHGNMAALAVGGGFDGAYCFGNSFGYMQHELTINFIARLAAALKPGGRFALDYGAVAESLLPALAPEARYEVGDIVMEIANHYVAPESRLETRYSFSRNGSTEVREGSQFVYTVAELRRMLSAARLETVALHSSIDGQPFGLGSQRLLLVAEKHRH